MWSAEPNWQTIFGHAVVQCARGIIGKWWYVFRSHSLRNSTSFRGLCIWSRRVERGTLYMSAHTSILYGKSDTIWSLYQCGEWARPCSIQFQCWALDKPRSQRRTKFFVKYPTLKKTQLLLYSCSSYSRIKKTVLNAWKSRNAGCPGADGVACPWHLGSTNRNTNMNRK